MLLAVLARWRNPVVPKGNGAMVGYDGMRPVKLEYADLDPMEFSLGMRLAMHTMKAMRWQVQRGGRGYPRLWTVLRAMFLTCLIADSAWGA